MSIKPLSRKGVKLEPDPKAVSAKKAKKLAKRAEKVAEAAAAAPAPTPAALAAPAPVAPPAPEVVVPPPVPKVKEPRPERTKVPRYVRPQVEKRAPAAPLPPLFRTNRLTGKLLSKVVPPLPPPEADAAVGPMGRLR